MGNLIIDTPVTEEVAAENPWVVLGMEIEVSGVEVVKGEEGGEST